MKALLKITSAILATASLSACVSFEEVTPTPIDSKHSFAYNIAAQTALTRDNSPLRDFTQEEIEEAKAAVNKSRNNGGNLALLTGAISLVKGDVMGWADIAGGSALKLGDTRHAAGMPRWIVAVPAEQFATKQEASIYIYQKIKSTLDNYYKNFGDVFIDTERKSKYYVYSKIKSGDNEYDLYIQSKELNVDDFVVKTKFPFDGELKEAYVYGANHDSNHLIKSPPPVISGFLIAMLNERLTTRQIYKDVTKMLPKEFYFYVPSFQKHIIKKKDGSLKIYRDLEVNVPTIYSHGEEYQFIKKGD